VGLVEESFAQIVLVTWELAGGPAAWPSDWVRKVADSLLASSQDGDSDMGN
jgi:hypothetical protein